MSLTTVYVFCALIGGTLLLCQFLLTLIGAGGDEVDVGGDVGDVGGDVGDVDADAGDTIDHLEDGESPPSGAGRQQGAGSAHRR